MEPPLAVMVLEFAAAVVCIGLAFVVLRAARSRNNELLAMMLLLEGLSQWGWGVADIAVANGDVALADLFIAFALVAFAGISVLYLFVVRGLETQFARPLKAPWFSWTLAAFLLAAAANAAGFMVLHRGAFNVWGDIDPGAIPNVAVLAGPIAVIMVYAFVCAVSAWRRAAPSSLMRARARAYAVAFGTRDLLYVLAIIANIGVGFAIGPRYQAYTYPIWSAASLLFAVFLGYGILRTQLFDLDLKIKIGISRSTVVAFGIVCVFAAAKVVEFYLNKAVGFVAAGIAAGMLLFMAPRLNKLGDRVANAALPQVQPTSEYLAFKKLEVYRAAVESANETGGLTDKDRASLSHLRAKLGLAEGDARAIEAEVVGPAASGLAA